MTQNQTKKIKKSSKGVVAKIIAIIPARGGSKGIPRKNLISFNKLPLVVNSIKHGLSSSLIERVIVSTEDDEIAKISSENGAEIIKRPKELARDEVLDWPVFNNVLEELEKDEDPPEIIVHLRPTAPFRKTSWIDEAIELLIDNDKADSVRSVSHPVNHPYRVFRINNNGYLESIMGHEHPEPFLLRRQDLPHLYYYNCVIDVTRYNTIINKKTMTGDSILPYIMDTNDVIDIDTHRDLLIAKALYEDNK